MLLVRETGIAANDTAGDLHDRLARLGAEAVVEAIAGWAAGSLLPVAQPADGATYAAKIRKEEALIDWASPAAAIGRQVRAFNPWPVAETRWQGRQLRIWEARPLVEAPGEPAPGGPGGPGAPGQVIDAGPGRLVVSADDGFLEIFRLQLAGRNAMAAAEFLNANPLVGETLG